MTQAPHATSALQRAGSLTGRMMRAFRALPHERRLAVYASLGLFLTLFLPWYQRQFFTVVAGKPVPASDTQTAWGAFSFVEAAVLLVAAGVLTLLFQRAEGRAFHVPGGDGGVITAAGCWTCLLVVWRIFDKQGGQTAGQNVVTNGIEWGIFVALGVGILLTYAGTRIRAAHQPEPPLPGEGESSGAPVAVPEGPRVTFPRPGRSGPGARVRQPRPVRADEPPTERFSEDPPTRRLRGDPATERLRGDPATERLGGDPATERLRGDPATERLRGDPATERLGGDPATERLRGDPATERLGGDPATERLGGDPATERLRGDPATERLGGDPATERLGESTNRILKARPPADDQLTIPFEDRES